jgi:hypothetical protein
METNFAIITQVKNQENRIYDWIKYHYHGGFDTFVIFDDFSEDKTIDEIKRAEQNIPVKIILNNTDGVGGTYNINDCNNSDLYVDDKSFNARLNRSYTKGNNIIKEINPNAICAVIDVDEFLMTNEDKKITSVISNIMDESSCAQLLVYNFDVEHNYNLENGFLFKNNFKRWDYDDLDNHHIWRTRSKCIIISKCVDVISFVHIILPLEKSFECRNYSRLRMLHFRIPNLSGKSFPGGETDSIKFVEDHKLNDLLTKIK